MQSIKIIITDLDKLIMNKKRRCRECKEYKLASEMLVINNGAYCNIECCTQHAYKKGKQDTKKRHALKAD